MFHSHLTDAKRTRKSRTKVPAFLSHLQHLYDNDENVIASRRASVMLEPALERKLENINNDTAMIEEQRRPATSNDTTYDGAYHIKVDSVQQDQMPKLEDLQKPMDSPKISMEKEPEVEAQA